MKADYPILEYDRKRMAKKCIGKRKTISSFAGCMPEDIVEEAMP